MSPALPQLKFTSMIDMASQVRRLPAGIAVYFCVHPFGGDIDQRAVYLYRYRFDFDEVGLHVQGLAGLCGDCLTMYWSEDRVQQTRAGGSHHENRDRPEHA